MPAKWQQWMPFHIDRFFGSPSVRAMHPAAQLGYIALLAAAWQSEDCTIPNDPDELAEKSALGEKLWKMYGPRILRKFETVSETGRLRNYVCFCEWQEAKRIFEARRESAHRTNTGRSSDGHRAVTEQSPVRSLDTRTTVVPVVVDVPVSVRSNGKSGLEPEMLARGLGETLGLSIGYGPGSLNTALTEVAETEMHAGRNLEDVAVEMEASYRFYLQEKPNLRIHWGPAKFFGEGHWRDPTAWPRKEKTRAEQIKEWSAGDDD